MTSPERPEAGAIERLTDTAESCFDVMAGGDHKALARFAREGAAARIELARLRSERDAARAENERLRAARDDATTIERERCLALCRFYARRWGGGEMTDGARVIADAIAAMPRPTIAALAPAAKEETDVR